MRDEIENALSYYALHLPARDSPPLRRARGSSSTRPRRAVPPHGQLDRRRPRRQPQRRCRRPSTWRCGGSARRRCATTSPRCIELGAELSMSRTLRRLHAGACRRSPTRSGDDNPHRDDEPYRRALIGVYARLAGTLREADRHRGAAPRGRARRALSRARGDFLADLATHRRFAAPPITATAMVAQRLGAADPRRRGVRLPSRHHRSAPELRPARGRRWPSCCAAARIEPDYAGARRRTRSSSSCSRLLQDPRSPAGARRRPIQRGDAGANSRSSRRRASCARPSAPRPSATTSSATPRR